MRLQEGLVGHWTMDAEAPLHISTSRYYSNMHTETIKYELDDAMTGA